MTQSELIKTLSDRGYIYQATNIEGLDNLSINSGVLGYIGFDCTARSLHIGNLLAIMLLRQLQKFGHTPIILLGGSTTTIGDPSGRNEARAILTKEEIETNKRSLSAIFGQFINLDEAICVDNAEWLTGLNYLDFLSQYGRYFSVNRMLTFDSVKVRLDKKQPLSFLEFNYMLLQAYDFVELYKRYGCRLQMGGSDQWGNIVNGIDLAHRLQLPELFGLTAPLITTSTGAKMGKSVSGAVWLDSGLLSPYDYWQFWRNTDDADVIKFLKLFTDLPLKEIEEISQLKGKEINEAKIILASEATTMCHGSAAAASALATARQTFENDSGLGLGQDLPVIEIAKKEIEDGMPAFKLLTLAGLCESNSIAKKLVQGNAFKVNNQLLTAEQQTIDLSHFAQSEIKLSVGKKKHVVLRLR